MSDLAFRAMEFARHAHRNQARKYTGNPYAEHLAEVAGIVSSVAPLKRKIGEAMVAVAWLHDTMEDQGVSYGELRDLFGDPVAIGVRALSDHLEQGNRAQRKAATRMRLSTVFGWIQTIKVADVISNTQSIALHDPDFAKVYVPECLALLDVMRDADERLVQIARVQLSEVKR